MRAAHADVRNALEETGLDVPLVGAIDLLEKLDALFELALVVLRATHQIEQLVVEIRVVGRVELLELVDTEATDLVDDSRGLRQLRAELRKPLQGLIEEEMVATHLTDLVEHRERGLVVAQMVERLAEEELRLLHVCGRVL